MGHTHVIQVVNRLHIKFFVKYVFVYVEFILNGISCCSLPLNMLFGFIRVKVSAMPHNTFINRLDGFIWVNTFINGSG